MSLLSQVSSIFSLLSLFLWSWSLSLLRHSLSSFLLSLSLILVSLRQMLRWWRNKAWLRSAWEPVAGIRGFWWSGFSGFHRSHFLLSFSFTGLLSFTFFFHPKRKTLRFWVWVWAKIKRDEDGRNNDCRERMAGAWVCGGVVSVGLWVCGGWPVGAWWWLVVGLWRWGCGFGIMEVGLCFGFASDEREEDRREEEIEKWTKKNERERGMNKK